MNRFFSFFGLSYFPLLFESVSIFFSISFFFPLKKKCFPHRFFSCFFLVFFLFFFLMGGFYVWGNPRLVLYTFIFEPAFCAQITKKNTPSSYVELACCRRASATRQHSAISHAKSSEARNTSRSKCDNASESRQSCREPACPRASICSSLYY